MAPTASILLALAATITTVMSSTVAQNGNGPLADGNGSPVSSNARRRSVSERIEDQQLFTLIPAPSQDYGTTHLGDSGGQTLGALIKAELAFDAPIPDSVPPAVVYPLASQGQHIIYFSVASKTAQVNKGAAAFEKAIQTLLDNLASNHDLPTSTAHLEEDGVEAFIELENQNTPACSPELLKAGMGKLKAGGVRASQGVLLVDTGAQASCGVWVKVGDGQATAQQ